MNFVEESVGERPCRVAINTITALTATGGCLIQILMGEFLAGTPYTFATGSVVMPGTPLVFSPKMGY